jgi:prepilin-type N-terminal cleavage/methylation domain-containing protein
MPRLTPARRARLRRGFTLVEMLITLGVLSIVGTVAAKLMMGQQRFYQRTSEQMGMRRELRSAMSLVPGDLRAISSSGGDISAMSSTSITFRNVLGTGVVCARGNSWVELPPTDQTRNKLTSWYTAPTVGDTIWAFNDSLSRGAEDDVWTPLRITGVATSSAYCGASAYTDNALDAGMTRYHFDVSPSLPDSVVVGSALRFTRSVKYEVQQQTSGRYYLTRSEYTGGAWQGAVPISGPYMAPANGAGGVTLAYYDSLGAAVNNVAQSRSVSRIDLALRVQGANSSGMFGTSSTTNTDSLFFRIALRNRQ